MATFEARVKSEMGACGGMIPTITSATTCTLPMQSSVFYVSGSTKIDYLYADPSQRGQRITLIGAAGGTASLDNVNDTTTVGQMDLGGSDVNVAAQDVVVLFLKDDGTWVRISNVDN